MRVFEEKQRFTQWWLHLIVTLPISIMIIFFCVQWYVYAKPVDKVGASDYGEQVLTLVLLAGTALLVLIFRLQTTIDERGFHYRFFPFHLSEKSVSWYDIENCYTRTYSPIGEYGGWGIRGLSKKNRAYNVKGNQGIQLVLKNGNKLLLGTQHPEKAQQVIDKYFKK